MGWPVGSTPVPQHVHPFVRRLIEEANEQKVPLREVARRAGLSFKTISEWRYSRSPSLVNITAALNALGIELKLEKVA